MTNIQIKNTKVMMVKKLLKMKLLIKKVHLRRKLLKSKMMMLRNHPSQLKNRESTGLLS